MLRSDPCVHYKMYKSKKNMVYAALFSFAVLGGLSLSQNAKADTVENDNTAPTIQTTAVTSQSATSTQSSAADVNAVNSASGAQSVSNSNAGSAANAASQTQTATLNIQSTRPAQNTAVTSQANIYAQNLVQVPAQNEAQNVQGDWTWGNNNPTEPDTNKTIESTVGKDFTQRMGVNLSFDVDANQLTVGNQIHIAKLTQTSNNSGMAAYNAENANVPVYLRNQQIGVLNLSAKTLPSPKDALGDRFSELNYTLIVQKAIPNLVGTQHISVNADWIGTINYHTPWSFRGVKDSLITFNLIGNGLNKTYKVHCSWPSDIQVNKDQTEAYSINPNAGDFLGDDGNVNAGLWIDNPILYNATSAQLDAFHQSAGKQGQFNINQNLQYGLRVYANKNNTILLGSPTSSTVMFTIPIMNSNGEMVVLPNQDNWNEVEDGNNRPQIPNKIAADGLTLTQLKAENFIGILSSRQSDGSVLVYYNLPLSLFQIPKPKLTDDDVQTVMNNSPYINNQMSTDPEARQLAQKILDSWMNGPMQGTPRRLYISWGNFSHVSDPSSHPQVFADLLDSNTGEVINHSISNGQYTSSMAHGQAAVKLHVINATNGTELNQVQNFVDWPNQGKKANLSLPNIRGYQVVSDASAASAALQKLGLKGNVVTQAEAVDYPAADNTTNYYIVMDPVTETATVHFIDQDSGNKELSHVDLTGAYNTPITANGQVTNMLNNYVNNQGYELVSNDLAGNHLYTDAHQDFNIVLKHKTQKRNPDNDPSDATKDITRTINVHNPDGSVKTTTQTAHLTREGVQDEATKQTTWGAWSTGNWAEFDTPAVQDYTPSQAKVNAQTVDSNTQDQTIDITYKANILNKDVDFVVPEVIHRTDQHGQTTIDRTQNVTLHGTVTYNAATSQLVGFDLHSADFPAYDIPQIDGYTSHVQEDHIVSLIPGDTNFDKDAFLKDPSGYFNQIMKGRQGGLDHVIDAKTIPQTTAMQYKDGSVDRSYDFYITYTADPQSAQVIYYDTILKKNVKTDTLNGKTDETVNTNIQVPANYVLVPGQNLPTTYTFKGSNNQNIIVNLTHATKDTTTTDPGAHKTVTRTIIVNTPHDGAKTTKQDVQLTRSATLDLVTNTTTYGNWNTGIWAQYDTPAVPGYTPTQGSVPQATVTGDTQNTTVTVNYTANPHVQVIEYVGDGKVQHTQNVNGVTDQTVNGIKPEVPTNWVLAPGAKVPTSVTFGPNDPQPIIVNIVHDTKDVTKTDAGAHKTITRTIHVNDPHNGTSTTNQVVNLTRPAWFDMVTNDIHYGEWNTGNWAEFDSPAVAGYTVNPAKVAAQTVTSDTKDTIVNVDYTANPQQVVLNFVDKAGNVIATHLYKGVTDGTAKIDAQVPTNWVLVPGQTIPTSYTFKASDNHDIDIVIEHGTKDTSKTDKNAVRDVTRVINLHDPHKGTTTTKQVAHLHRSATLDLVTNQTTYGKWDTDATNWKEFDVPAVDGYTPNMSKVAAATVDENTKDQTIDVTYAANPQQVVLNFVDKAGNVIASHTYKGVTDGTAKIDAQVPENWVLVKGQTIPTDYTFKAENNKDIDILIEHGMQDVSKTDEKANKDITRTIIVTNPDGKKTTTNQVAHLNRSAIKDLVTGEVTYGQWNTGKWDAFDTPEIAGYDASIHHLDGQNVDINDEDETINIHYNALTHTQDINYVDDNGDVVGTQVVTGQTGETAGFTPDVPNGYTIVPGQDIPKSFTFGANDPKTLVIHVTKPGNNSQTPASGQPASNEPASQTPAQSESGSGSNAAPASDNSVAPSAPASANTNAGTETSYAAPATAAPVATAAPIAQTSGNSNAGQGTLPQTGDNSISAIAGLSLAGMTGAILAAGALKRRHN